MRCHIPWTTTYIFPAGSVACCMAGDSNSTPLAASWIAKGKTWSYLRDGMDWWQTGEIMQQVRTALAGQEGVVPCGSIPRCGHPGGLHSPEVTFATQKQVPVYNENLAKLVASFDAGQTVVSHLPVAWFITMGELCSLRCRHCFQRIQVNPDSLVMPLDVAENLASYAPNALYWHLTGGEPFAFPDDLLDILLVKPDVAPQLYTNLYTSLSPATPERFKQYVDRIRAITVSLDACSRRRYEKVKTGAKFDHLIANLELAKASGIRLHANFVVTRSNMVDLSHIIEFALRYGIVQLQVSRVVNTALLKRGLPEEDIFIAGQSKETDDLLFRSWSKMKRDSQGSGVTVFDGGVQAYLQERGYDVFDAIGEN